MSDYEKKAWERLTKQVTTPRARGPLGEGFARASNRISEASNSALDAGRKIPGALETADIAKKAFEKAVSGLHGVTVDFGLNSVSTSTVVKRAQKAGHDISSFDDIHTLDLKVCDLVGSSKKQKYAAAGLVEGAASSLAITGLTVSTTVSGGASLGVVTGVIAADTVAVLTGMGRIVASVAASYGYDTRLPEEAIFAAGVLSYSTSRNATESAIAMAALSNLTQQMMRQATWSQLSSNILVKAVQTVFKAIGIKLTHNKLAQVIPFVGVAINGGLNAKIAHDTVERAHTAYRLRFLTEKYDLDPGEWRPEPVDDGSRQRGPQIPRVDEIIEAEIVDVEESDDL